MSWGLGPQEVHRIKNNSQLLGHALFSVGPFTSETALTSGHWHNWLTAGIPHNEDVSGAVTMAESRAECMWLLDRLAPKEPLPNSLVRSSLLPSESMLEAEPRVTVAHAFLLENEVL